MAKVPVFDWATGEFVRTGRGGVASAEEAAAVEQIVIKAQQTPRGAFLIYAADPDVPEDPGNLYGSEVGSIIGEDLDEATRQSEIERTVREAIIYDPYILNVANVVVTQDRDSAVVTADIEHIYGDTVELGFNVREEE